MPDNPLRRARKRVSRSLLREELDRQQDLLKEEVRALEARVEAGAQQRADRLASELAYVHGELERLEGVVLRPPWANLIGEPLRKLDAYTAAFLNYAIGEYGYAAQAGLRLAPAAAPVHGEGSVSLGAITARVVELPFAIRALAALPPGAAVLDVGAAASELAHSLAALGCRVTALDPVPYPLPHPAISSVERRLEEWEGPPDGAFDAIVALSVLEHVGMLEFQEEADADLAGMERLRAAAREGATLVLSLPVGSPAAQWSSRVYDRARADSLLAGWTVEESLLLTAAEHGWDAAPDPGGELPEGRLLVRARRA